MTTGGPEIVGHRRGRPSIGARKTVIIGAGLALLGLSALVTVTRQRAAAVLPPTPDAGSADDHRAPAAVEQDSVRKPAVVAEEPKRNHSQETLAAIEALERLDARVSAGATMKDITTALGDIEFLTRRMDAEEVSDLNDIETRNRVRMAKSHFALAMRLTSWDSDEIRFGDGLDYFTESDRATYFGPTPDVSRTRFEAARQECAKFKGVLFVSKAEELRIRLAVVTLRDHVFTNASGVVQSLVSDARDGKHR